MPSVCSTAGRGGGRVTKGCCRAIAVSTRQGCSVVGRCCRAPICCTTTWLESYGERLFMASNSGVSLTANRYGAILAIQVFRGRSRLFCSGYFRGGRL